MSSTVLLILQWILALVAIIAFARIWGSAWREPWLVALIDLLIPPLFPIVYAWSADLRLKKDEVTLPAITYAVCMMLAVVLQRVRLG